jgi:hypothetical protein
MGPKIWSMVALQVRVNDLGDVQTLCRGTNEDPRFCYHSIIREGFLIEVNQE